MFNLCGCHINPCTLDKCGHQPKGGRMYYTIDVFMAVPGFSDAKGKIVMAVPGFSNVKGTSPNPSKMYTGIHNTAFLPNNRDAREVLRLLEEAFDAGVIFTIGESRTTEQQGVITWSDIHHKTSLTGGHTNFGYPDDGYLKRVKEELAAKGIIDNDKSLS